jgi:hypothetical protein
MSATGKETKPALSAAHRKMLAAVRETGLVNFEQLGKIVAQVTPTLFDPGVAADDYVVKAYTDVLQIWKVGLQFGNLEEISALKAVAVEIEEE